MHNVTQKIKVASYLQRIHLYLLQAAKMENAFPHRQEKLDIKLNILGEGLERHCFIRIVTAWHSYITLN